MWVLFLALAMASNGVTNADVYVVVHEGMSLTAAEVRAVYVGDKEFSGGLRLVPVDNMTARAEFVRTALAMTPERYDTLWIKKSFRDALNPPARKSTDAEVLEFVQRTRGAVGYVSLVPVGTRVTVVGRVE